MNPRLYLSELGPDSPLRPAAAGVLHARLKAVRRRARAVARTDRPEPAAVHDLRSTARRAAVAVRAFADLAPSDESERLIRVLRAMCRRGGRVRDMDIASELLGEIAAHTRPEHAAFAMLAGHAMTEARREAECPLVRACRKSKRRKLRRREHRLLRAITESSEEASAGSRPLIESARAVLRDRAESARQCLAQDLTDPRNLHQARKAMRELRFAAELFVPCGYSPAMHTSLESLKEHLTFLGAANDTRILIRACQSLRLPHDPEDPTLAAKQRDGFIARLSAIAESRHKQALRGLFSTGESLIAPWRAWPDGNGVIPSKAADPHAQTPRLRLA